MPEGSIYELNTKTERSYPGILKESHSLVTQLKTVEYLLETVLSPLLPDFHRLLPKCSFNSLCSPSLGIPEMRQNT